MNHKKFWTLEDVNLFQVMCPHKVEDFGSGEEHFRYYQKGETIYFTEDPSNTMYLIAKGKVRLLNYSEAGEEVVRAILGRGEMFGELAILGEEKRGEIAEAMDDDTVVCPVRTDQVYDLMKDNKEFTFKIYQWIGFRLKKMERRIDNLIFKDVRGRLMDFIREQALEKGEKQGPEVRIRHHFTHQNIAHLIGTSRQTVTTTLNEMRAEGLIDFDRNRIVIKRLDEF